MFNIKLYVTDGTAAQVSHAGVSQQLPKHAGSRFLPRLQHLHCLVTEEDEEKDEEEELCVFHVIPTVTVA